MSNIKLHLEQILTVKNQIRQALVRKGVEENTPFAAFPQAIEDLVTDVVVMDWGNTTSATSQNTYINPKIKIEARMPDTIDTVYYSAFMGLPITTVTGKNIDRICPDAFRNCTKLSKASFPNCTLIENYAFMYCGIEDAVFPLVSTFGDAVFSSCSSLKKIIAPNATSIKGTYLVSGCLNLSCIYMPKLPTVNNFQIAVYAMPSVSIYLRDCSQIYSYGLYQLSNLDLYLLGDKVCGLTWSGAFHANFSKTGNVFVRTSLLQDYATATNWTYYSSRFTGLTDDEITSIETAFENMQNN